LLAKASAYNFLPATRSSPLPVRSIALKISLMIFLSGWPSTARKAVSMAHRLRVAMVFATIALAVCLGAAQNTAPRLPVENTFTDSRAASALLRQLSESLQGHSQKKFLAIFDLQKMKDGQLFKQQINSFFSQTESIRVHLNLME